MVALKRVTVKLDQVTGGDSVGRESSGLIEWNAVHAAPSDSARVRTFGKRSVTLLGGGPQRKDGTRLASGRLREELCHGHPYLVTLSGMARGFVQTGTQSHWHVSASAKRYFRHRAFKMRAFTCLPWETGQNASVVDPSLFPWRFRWKRRRWFCSVS